jgi:hypothetical protein
MRTLHVTNGESVARTLHATSLGGTVLAWDDALHEGPLADVPPAELRALRARFLARHGWGDGPAIAAELAARDEALARAVDDGDAIVLWFEHDLFDQLQLLQVLAALGDAEAGQVELVQTDSYLGTLRTDELERLWPIRRAVEREVIELGRSGWEAVCAGEVERFLARDTSALPYLDAALCRLLEERAPLSRTKRQPLAALADGPKLTGEGLVAQVGEESEPFADALLELTPAGRELV